jgi:hypothetical protein
MSRTRSIRQLLAATATAALCLGVAAQQETLIAADSSLGSTGSFCDTLQTCVPVRLDVARGSYLNVWVRGGNVLLLVDLAPAACIAIPGVVNPLLLSQPLCLDVVPLLGRIHDAPCVSWFGRKSYAIHGGIPAGTGLLLQGLTHIAGSWTLTNGIEARVQ